MGDMTKDLDVAGAASTALVAGVLGGLDPVNVGAYAARDLAVQKIAQKAATDEVARAKGLK